MKKFILTVLILNFLHVNAQVPVISNITGPTTRCSAPTATLGHMALASNSPTSYSWSVVPSAPIINNGGPQAIYVDFPVSSTSWSTTYTITCIASNASGASAPFKKVVTVYNTQVATFLGSQNICKGESTTLTVSTIPSSTPNYTWTPSTFLSSSSSGVVVANPIVTTTYNVYVNDFSCPWLNTVTIQVNECTSVFESQANLNSSVTIFPNPSKEKLYLISENNQDLKLMNMQGQVLETIHLIANEKVSVDGLMPGFYVLKGEYSSASKLISVQGD